jgi:hypothetical protein
MPRQQARGNSPLPYPVPAFPGPARLSPLRSRMKIPARAHVAPVELYRTVSAQIPISGAQGMVVVSGGTATISVGPTGLGTVWYPASAVIATSIGPLDTSVCKIYVGPSQTPVSLQGTLISGGAGTLGLALPSMSPGLYIIAVWSGATNGSTASLNITGYQTVLTR